MSTALDINGVPIPDGMHEYAFDVKLFATVRVIAASPAMAAAAMENVVDSMKPTGDWSPLYPGGKSKVLITEVSLAEDGENENRVPFEIDGVPT